MHWFLIAIGAPLLWAVTNHIDKHLLDKHLKRGGAGTLMIFSSVIGIITLPFLFLANPAVLGVGTLNIILLLLNSALAAIVLWLYFEALKEEEASIVVLFYQLIPVFGVVLGYVLLDEVLTGTQLLAIALVLLGTMIVSVEIDMDNKFRLRRRTAMLMTLAALLAAFESVLFKYVAITETIWISLFWEYVGLSVIGILLFCLVGSYRNDFLHTIRRNSKNVFALNTVNELLYLAGNFLFAYSYLLAPIALVLLVNSYQPLAVLGIGMLIAIFLPKIGGESIRIVHVGQKLLSIVIVGIGTYLLFIP